MSSHCCDMMTKNVEKTCADHPNRSDCPDCIIGYWPTSDTYGILVHDGGSSMIVIAHCPWCGTALPSEREEAE